MAGMKKWLVVAGVALALAAGLAAQQPSGPAQSASLLVRDVTLIDGTGSAPRPGMNIFTRDGRIESIVAAGATVPDADLTLSGRGLTAMPGLIDAHVHLSPAPWPEVTAQLRQALRGGVTSVYDVAGDARNTGDLARAAMAGEIESPGIYYLALMAGPAFFSDPRVVGASLGFAPGSAPWNQETTPETDIVRAVAAARGSGATGIKLYAALDAATVRRVAAEAKQQHMRLVAHGTVFPAKPSDLVAAGVDMLAHAAYLVWEGSPPSAEFQKRAQGDFAGVPPDSPAIEALLRSMKERGVALNPTLWIFASGQAKDDLAAARTAWGNAVTRRAQELGVTIAAGTDSMIGSGAGALPTLHEELATLVAGAGLTPMQALVAATSGAARAMGVDGTRGTLEAGKAADLVLIDGNPLDDIRATRRIRYVIKDGRIVHQQPAGRTR
jgi:imidazolonepropionase-like amidohydrolase